MKEKRRTMEFLRFYVTLHHWWLQNTGLKKDERLEGNGAAVCSGVCASVRVCECGVNKVSTHTHTLSGCLLSGRCQ